MKAFIKALNKKAWRFVFTSWKHPTIKDDRGNVTLTPEEKWSGDDGKFANYNFKALNAIFNGFGVDQINLITTCESCKRGLGNSSNYL